MSIFKILKQRKYNKKNNTHLTQPNMKNTIELLIIIILIHVHGVQRKTAKLFGPRCKVINYKNTV